VRPIANNVYAQIAAETGFIALLVFVGLLGYLVFQARKESDATLGLIVATAVGLIAFPAWTGLPIWTVIGAVIVLVSPARPRDDHPQNQPEPALSGPDTIEREEE
jgi:O-antigen ligase